MASEVSEVIKQPTGISGVDEVMFGGLPAGRTTLVAGSAGSGKTILALQFLHNGLLDGDGGVFVTFEEPPEDIRNNAASLGWDLLSHEQTGRFAIVDASPSLREDLVVGDFDLGALLARIEHAVSRTGATRVGLDSLGAVFTRFDSPSIVRRELRRIGSALREMGVTSVLTAERTEEYGPIARFGVEEFVADNVVILRNVLEDERRRRTIEVLKFRGTGHMRGEFPFMIAMDRGIIAVPLSTIDLEQPSSNVRATAGVPELDRMLGGGYYRDSIILLSGATGTGKTLNSMHFVDGGLDAGERVLLVAFEESRDQLFRNAIGWGFDFESAERSGQLKVVCQYPESQSLESHLLTFSDLLAEFVPHRVVVDSLSALERVGSERSFREFVIGLTSLIKQRSTAGLFTSTTPTLLGGASVTEANISTITDTIVLLRYAEVLGSMRRGMTVLKMRGSQHDKNIREFTIDHEGIHIGRPFHNVGGILSGNPVHLTRDEVERMTDLFPGPPPPPDA